MPAAVIQPSSYLDARPSSRDRMVSAALALGITALIVILMIEMGVVTIGHPPSQPAVVMLQLPGQGTQQTRQPEAKKRSHDTRGGAKPAPSVTHASPPTPAHHDAPVPWNVIPLTSSEFAASDIASMPSHRGASQVASADDGSGSDRGSGSGSGDSAGGAPGGDQILDAYLAHAPTRAELAPYQPKVMRDGFGEIECILNVNKRLEDCKETDETPGSGLSRMMRQAAWQFVIVPPRINGRPVTGVRVRVHYTFTTVGGQDQSGG